MECSALVPYGLIYAIRHKQTGKPYIGQTKQTLALRMCNHMSGSQFIDREIAKEGIGNFDYFPLMIAPTRKNRYDLERFFIKVCDSLSPSGYNLTDGGHVDPNRKQRTTKTLSLAFGQRVIELRNEREWSQKHLASTAGVDQGYISRIESGQTEPCLVSLAVLAKAFGLGLSEMLDGV
jgi:DNA-binding XRE family transcriptional regulator